MRLYNYLGIGLLLVTSERRKDLKIINYDITTTFPEQEKILVFWAGSKEDLEFLRDFFVARGFKVIKYQSSKTNWKQSKNYYRIFEGYHICKKAELVLDLGGKVDEAMKILKEDQGYKTLDWIRYPYEGTGLTIIR